MFEQFITPAGGNTTNETTKRRKNEKRSITTSTLQQQQHSTHSTQHRHVHETPTKSTAYSRMYISFFIRIF